MPIDPKESREAHSQIGRIVPTAGSVLSQEQFHSPALRDARGPLAIDPVRVEVDGQPFPLAPGGVVGNPILPRHFSPPRERSVRPISPTLLQQMLDRKPVNLLGRMVANDRALGEHNRRAMGGRLGFAIFLFGLIIFAASVGGLLR